LNQAASAELRFTFIANACGVFTGAHGTRLLCDPWLVDGVFEGSWCHFAPLKTQPADVQDVDAIYVSHLHPDHFDVRHFDFDRDKPIVVLDHGPNFLGKALERMGFRNLLQVRNGETVRFREFEFTLFAPFAKHNFHEAEVGNLIDSAILVRSGARSVLNANDNTLSVQAARELRERFGQFDLAMLNYNAAGPYPSCFDNLTLTEKHQEHDRILKRNFDHMLHVLHALQPRAVLPFAGAYVLGGRQSDKNDYLGTATWDTCADYLLANDLQDSQVVLLREGDTLDLDTLESDHEYVPIDVEQMRAYIRDTLASKPYPYELDDAPDPNRLLQDIRAASQGMQERMRRHGIHPRARVLLAVKGKRHQIYPQYSDAPAEQAEQGELLCSMDERLLRRILDRKAHWNNAEIGAHISFVRHPNHYEPDLHTGLQFFHV
jgi:UDP-MurNAc hydroxylase